VNDSLKKFRISLFLYFLCLYIMTAHGIRSWDNVLHYEKAYNFIKNGSLSLPDAYNPEGMKFGSAWFKVGENEKIYTTSQADGLSVAAMPFCFIGMGIDKLKHVDNLKVEADKLRKIWKVKENDEELFSYGVQHFNLINKLPSAFFSTLVNSFAVAFLILIFFNFCYRLTNSKEKAFVSTLLLGNASIIWVYSGAFWSQTIVALCLFAAFYFIYVSKEENNIKFLIYAGIFAGYSYITRHDSVLSLPFFVFYVISMNWGEKKEILKRFSFFVLPLFIFLFLQLGWNYHRFGSMLAASVGSPTFKLLFFNRNLPVLLFGFSKSIFLFSLPLILSIIGFKKFFKEHKLETVTLTGISLTYLIAFSAFGSGVGMIDAAWGPRHLVPIIPLLMLPVCAFVGLKGWKKIITLIFFIFGLAIQILGVISMPYTARTLSIKDQYFKNIFTVVNTLRGFYTKSEIVLKAKLLFSGYARFWMFESIPKLFVGLILLGLSSFFLLYCLRELKKDREFKKDIL
jgi:hypothetical protein